jgi:Fur family ferric uptake transcriptional regulator
MASAIETFNEILQTSQNSITKQRQRIFKYLLTNGPLETSQLIKGLNGEVDKVSVYRTIHLFESLGILQRLNNGFKYKLELSDVFASHHHHLTCINCNQVININATKLETFIKSIAREKDFSPTSHQVEVQGLCASCKAVLVS